MNCKDIEQDLYLYAELSAQERARVDEHLKTCTSCAGLRAAIELSEKQIHALATMPIEAQHAARLTRKIMDGIASPEVAESHHGILNSMIRTVSIKYACSALSIGLILLFGVQFYNVPNQPFHQESEGATVVIHSSSVRQAFTKVRQANLASIPCRSPFRSEMSVRNCLLNKYK